MGQYYPDNKTDNDTKWNEDYRPRSLMNTDEKILNKISSKPNLRTHWKNYTWLIANAIHHISRMKDKFNVLISKRCRKNLTEYTIVLW